MLETSCHLPLNEQFPFNSYFSGNPFAIKSCIYKLNHLPFTFKKEKNASNHFHLPLNEKLSNQLPLIFFVTNQLPLGIIVPKPVAIKPLGPPQ